MISKWLMRSYFGRKPNHADADADAERRQVKLKLIKLKLIKRNYSCITRSCIRFALWHGMAWDGMRGFSSGGEKEEERNNRKKLSATCFLSSLLYSTRTVRVHVNGNVIQDVLQYSTVHEMQ